MALQKVALVYGNAHILHEDVSVSLGGAYTYQPFSKTTFFDRDLDWGLYDNEGKISTEGAYRRGAAGTLVGQREFMKDRNGHCNVVDVPCVYFGPLIPHYGHFITTSLARAWYLDRAKSENRILLCHSDHSPEDHFKLPYVEHFLGGLGLEPSDFLCPTIATDFTDISVPGPSFVEEDSAYTSFTAMAHRIGDKILNRRDQITNDRPLYLSKSRTSLGSVSKISNEIEVENELSRRGVDICYPELLTIPQQIEIFARRRHILGFAGSAFHSHIFVRNPPRITGISLTSGINSNIILLDKLNHVNSNYYYSQNHIADTTIEGFSVSKVITDVQSFVSDLLERAEIPSGNITPGHHITQERFSMSNNNCVADHSGENYRDTLSRIHEVLKPRSYLEIGTLTGGTLALSEASSIAIDPKFQITSEVIGKKPVCLFYQLPSDTFFDRYDPKVLLGSPLDFSFLDGMHRCEFLLRDFMNTERHSSQDGTIALHDCLPVEIPMTDRTQNGSTAVMQHRSGWWTGDVWRTALLLKRRRPDLRILSLDAGPTGLVLISNLDPFSTALRNDYSAAVAEMMAMNLEEITVSRFLEEMEVRPTSEIQEKDALLRAIRG